MVRGIIFDLFGTVVSNTRLFRAVCSKMAEDSRTEVVEIERDFVNLYGHYFKDCHKMPFQPERYYYYLLISDLIDKYNLPGDIEVYCNLMYDSFSKLRAYPDARILTWIVKKYSVAILTNADNSFVEKVVKRNRLPHHFLLTSESARSYKPSEVIFEKLLSMMEIEKRHAIFVGDSIQADMLGASAAGIKGILIDRSRSYLDYVPRVESLEELPSLLESL
ncbi:MAG: HAD family hydrolase [Kosmotogaceae bacterium]|nr:HAD family hydrolase [Kosmotogaceae bacterium]